ncbi:MAG TPA: hypothetical protein VGQ83_30230 [Polyangia bacterium]
MSRLALLLAGAAVVVAAGCETATGHPPVARFSVSPRYVPEGDGCATVVTLDATASRDELDDPTGARQLWFRWDLDEAGCGGGGPDVASADLLSPVVGVRIRGDRPVTVTLTVLDASGVTAVRQGTIGITLGAAPEGDAGTPADAAGPADAGAGG